MRVGVVPHRHMPGVYQPGYKSKTYDWRHDPGTDENTRGVRAAYQSVELAEALGARYDTDAHLVSYAVIDPSGAPLADQPRVCKPALDWFLAEGFAIESQILICDVDNPGHAVWTPRSRRAFDELWQSPPAALQSAGVHLTRHGFHLFQPLDEPISVAAVERYLYAWLLDVAEALAPHGLEPDPACKDWTRHFRLPNVIRDGKRYITSFADFGRMAPIAVTPIDLPTPQARRARRQRRPREPVTVAPSAPDDWAERISALAAGMRHVTHGGHVASLAIAGELLHRNIDPALVPSIVADAAALAGWAGRADYRKNAADTVARWQAGLNCRRDVPPDVMPALDRVTSWRSALPIDLAAEQAKLRNAIENAPQGLSTVGAPCGIGKTYTAELVATARTEAGKRTVISVPTNALAEQITDHLRAANVPTLRIYGPASIAGDDGCRFRGTAIALAAGRQSVRWELCEGRGRHPCPHRETCPVVDGADGSRDAGVVVGNHGLLGELERAAAASDLLVIDEPPPPFEDHVITTGTLAAARAYLPYFEARDQLAPMVEFAAAVIAHAPADAPAHLTDFDVEAPALDGLLEAANALTVSEAAASALPERAHAPAIQRAQILKARDDNGGGLQPIAAASLTLSALHWAITCDDVRAEVYVHHVDGTRQLALTGINRRVRQAVQRQGRTVVTAADADLYADAYRQIVGYDVPHTPLSAPDGCQVRRILIKVKSASRQRWIRQRRPPVSTLQYALNFCAGRIAVVTFKGLVPWLRQQLPDSVDVGHYGALRGLDHWKGHDSLITLGDPVPNLASADRREIDPADAARAELEQAHGRLRVIHRTTPCTMIHVGRLVPMGWHEPIETYTPPRGRPAKVGHLHRSTQWRHRNRTEVREVFQLPAAGGVEVEL